MGEVFLGMAEVLLVKEGKVFPETEGGVLCSVAEEVMLEMKVHLEKKSKVLSELGKVVHLEEESAVGRVVLEGEALIQRERA